MKAGTSSLGMSCHGQEVCNAHRRAGTVACREEGRLLADERHLLAQPAQVQLLDVDAINAHLQMLTAARSSTGMIPASPKNSAQVDPLWTADRMAASGGLQHVQALHLCQRTGS